MATHERPPQTPPTLSTSPIAFSDASSPSSSSSRSHSPSRPTTSSHNGTATTPARRRRRRRLPAHRETQSSSNPGTIESSETPNAARRATVYLRDNLSDVSLESSALLDHRDQRSMRPRRSSIPYGVHGRSITTPVRHRHGRPLDGHEEGAESDMSEPDDRTPLIRVHRANTSGSLPQIRPTRPTTSDSASTKSGRTRPSTQGVTYGSVNFPPSVPGSPRTVPADFGHRPLDLDEDHFLDPRRGRDRDTIIDIEQTSDPGFPQIPRSETDPGVRSSAQLAEEDVCFPVDDDIIDEVDTSGYPRIRHRRLREWPDFSVLEEWSREEKEERSEGIRAKKLPEPVYVGGRLRPPVRGQWYLDEETAPYRFTYFHEDLPATIHSHTISELVQPGQTFRDLFKPEPMVCDDSSDEDDRTPSVPRTDTGSNVNCEQTTKQSRSGSPRSQSSAGQRPTFWLDVLRPTDAEMKVISRAFAIHPLTAEDIMMQEAREKVELFKHYYLVSYRTFEQDENSEDFMEPVNIYTIVFREGVISFHFSITPHPANVRRRIRQLREYIQLSADWISYALIDDITDAFGPHIDNLAKEADDIDDAVLRMHLDAECQDNNDDEKSAGNMLKRVGDCRRQVMMIYRLLGSKADVIKGFAKKCNEQWEVAPRIEIGLYLGDVQDHIVTMVSNLNHMEKILSRSHSNYLAQINIKMNERQEKTADVLGKLTVLGTIVLPMNIITGLWGMNVKVPGQEIDTLDWFWCITAGLFLFGFLCYLIAKRVYKIM
ncbi:cora-domain-containing protein [Ascodesmis nigricans]|uniref:Cora-domain-containing protein n=1 Tax=Ascodesmis nigricans TaxID=341454 RepID=A0A4S2MJ31_9PEZI|nr:cora-domain-containing protein [Ascodesmis nigricans]